ncbi:MAG TPA: hypothetical protein VJ934_08465 [Desulfomicrobiaceae bacterium]|nr:hypothetical protein [Desulfomicrobiaceae bacterium]
MPHFCARTYETRTRTFRISAVVQSLGPDVLVSIQGGAGHIGAVAMAEPRPSLSDPDRLSASTSVYCYLGHKEDEPAREMAKELAAALNARVVVVAGMHWDNLAPADLDVVKNALADLTRTIIKGEHAFISQSERT